MHLRYQMKREMDAIDTASAMLSPKGPRDMGGYLQLGCYDLSPSETFLLSPPVETFSLHAGDALQAASCTFGFGHLVA